jgi:hypothetical protein
LAIICINVLLLCRFRIPLSNKHRDGTHSRPKGLLRDGWRLPRRALLRHALPLGREQAQPFASNGHPLAFFLITIVIIIIVFIEPTRSSITTARSFLSDHLNQQLALRYPHRYLKFSFCDRTTLPAVVAADAGAWTIESRRSGVDLWDFKFGHRALVERKHGFSRRRRGRGEERRFAEAFFDRSCGRKRERGFVRAWFVGRYQLDVVILRVFRSDISITAWQVCYEPSAASWHEQRAPEAFAFAFVELSVQVDEESEESGGPVLERQTQTQIEAEDDRPPPHRGDRSEQQRGARIGQRSGDHLSASRGVSSRYHRGRGLHALAS